MAARANGAVERPANVGPSPDHGADVTIARIDRDHRPLDDVRVGVVVVMPPAARFALDLNRAPLDGALRHPLRLGVERGMDDDFRPRFTARAEHGIDQRTHDVERVGLRRFRRTPRHPRPWKGYAARALERGRAQVSLLAHEAEHEVAPGERPTRIPPRRVDGRPLGQCGQHGPFGNAEVTDALPEQVARRALDAVHTVPQVDRVEIQLEDLVLRQCVLEQPGNPQLQEFPPETTTAGRAIRQERVARDLHRYGRETFPEPERRRVAHDGPADAAPVEPIVIVEAPVFGGDECPPHVHRHRGKGHVHPADHVQASHRFSKPVENFSALGRLIGADGFRARTPLEAAREEPGVEDQQESERQSQRRREAPVPAHPVPGKIIGVRAE